MESPTLLSPRITPSFWLDDASGIDRDVSHIEVLAEGLSFIVRNSLRDGLLDHFANAAAAKSYFDSHHLALDRL